VKIIEKIINVESSEETIIERDETADEKKARLDAEAQRAAIEADRLETEQAKQTILDRLGITSDEAKLLLS